VGLDPGEQVGALLRRAVGGAFHLFEQLPQLVVLGPERLQYVARRHGALLVAGREDHAAAAVVAAGADGRRPSRPWRERGRRLLPSPRGRGAGRWPAAPAPASRALPSAGGPARSTVASGGAGCVRRAPGGPRRGGASPW